MLNETFSVIVKHRVQSQFAGISPLDKTDGLLLQVMMSYWSKSRNVFKRNGNIIISIVVVLLSIIWLLLKGSAKVKVVANPGDNLSMVSYSWGVSVPRK